MSQFGTAPPRFAIEVNDRTLMTRDYGFFVENRLRAAFSLEGIPVVIDFKGKEVMVVLGVVAFVVLLVLAYLCGSIPFGLVVGKLFYHVDVRRYGSGNVGTTNVFRVLGKKAGVAVLVCDMLKGYIPAIIAVWLFSPVGHRFHRRRPRDRARVLHLPQGQGRQGHRHRRRGRAGPRAAGVRRHPSS